MNACMNLNTLDEKQLMIKELLYSLTQKQKFISSKYLYDDVGSEIFQKITKLDEYYLTRCEKEILSSLTPKLIPFLENQNIDLIEIGPGDGSKAKILVKDFLKFNLDFEYYGLDISSKALNLLESTFSTLPVKVSPKLIVGDYAHFKSLLPSKDKNRRKLVLFLGSSIGNHDLLESNKIVNDIANNLTGDDLLLIGFDMLKDINILTKAYNDSLGLTAQFNLNLLHRFSKELQATFNTEDFYHLEYFDEKSNAMRSYLVSKKEQTVKLGCHTLHFKTDEKIHTESSYKYSKESILKLIENTPFNLKQEFYDSKKYFSCVLFQKKKVL